MSKSTTNPIDSVEQWLRGVGHDSEESVVLYEALCLEETGEWLKSWWLSAGDQRDTVQDEIGNNLIAASKFLRSDEVEVEIETADQAELLDAHLDSAWVHLCAAACLLGGDVSRLRLAWSEIHRSNVTDKKVDGKFAVDSSGKVTKPDGWTPPNLKQFFSN